MIPFVQYLGYAALAVWLLVLAALYCRQRHERLRSERAEQIATIICGKEAL